MKHIAGTILYLFTVMTLMEITGSHPVIGVLLLCAVAGALSARPGKKHSS